MRKILFCIFFVFTIFVLFGVKYVFSDGLCEQVSEWIKRDENIFYINNWSRNLEKNELFLNKLGDSEKLLTGPTTSRQVELDLSRLDIYESLLSAIYLFRVDDSISSDLPENISVIGVGIGRNGILIYLGQAPKKKSIRFSELENAIKFRNSNVAVYCRGNAF